MTRKFASLEKSLETTHESSADTTSRGAELEVELAQCLVEYLKTSTALEMKTFGKNFTPILQNFLMPSTVATQLY